MENMLNADLLKQFTQHALMEGSTSSLSLNGVKSLLQAKFLNSIKSEFTIENVIKMMDTNNDGRVNLDDFLSVMKRVMKIGQ